MYNILHLICRCSNVTYGYLIFYKFWFLFIKLLPSCIENESVHIITSLHKTQYKGKKRTKKREHLELLSEFLLFLCLQVELALDVERVVPEFIRRRYVTKCDTYKPNKRTLNPLKLLARAEAGDLSSQAISKALDPDLVSTNSVYSHSCTVRRVFLAPHSVCILYVFNYNIQCHCYL